MVIANLAMRPRKEAPGPSTFVSETLRIASWNIGFDDVAPRRQVLAEAIKAINADILLLIEFTPDKDLDPLLQALNSNYRAKIIQRRGKQNLVFLARKGISVANELVWTDIQLGNNDLRPALVADFRAGQFDFRLVGVHLKSKRVDSQSNPTKLDPSLVRDQQLNLLANHVSTELRGPEKDLIVVGDFNMIPEEDRAQFETLQAVGLTFPQFYLGDHQVSYLRSGGKAGSLLDGMGISPSAGEEYIKGSFQVMQLHQELGVSKAKFRRDYSDHLPVAADFNITVDRDP